MSKERLYGCDSLAKWANGALLPISFSFIKKKVQKNSAKLAAISDSIKESGSIMLS